MSNKPEDPGPAGEVQSIARSAAELVELAQSDLPAAEARFNALDFDRQLQLTLAVRGDDRKEMLYLKDDCTDLVQAYDPQVFYGMIKEIGVDQCVTLIGIATPEQVQHILDIECWRDGEIDRRSVLDWLQLLVQLDDDELRRILPGLEAEQLTAMLGPWISRATSPDAPPDVRTSRHYAVTPGSIDVDEPLVSAMLAEIYDADDKLFSRIVRMSLLEQDRAAEVEAAAQRDDRLEQKGFPSEADARLIYTEVPFEELPVAPQPEGETVPAPTDNRRFLSRVIDAIAARGEAGLATGEKLGRDLVALANKVAVADAINVSEPRNLEFAADTAGTYAGIGLELAAGGDVDVAADQLTDHGLEFLFRVGHTLLCDLRRHVWRELRGFDMAALELRLDPPHGDFLRAVRHPRPMIPAEGRRDVVRLIRSTAELTQITTMIDEIGDIALLHEDVLPLWPDALSAPWQTYGPVSATTAASAIIGKIPPAPLAPGDVPALRRALRVEPADSELVALQWLDHLLSQAGWRERPSAGARSFWRERIALMRDELDGLSQPATDAEIAAIESFIVEKA